MKRHTVHTRHPKYRVPVYERGGIPFLPFTNQRVEFPLDNPEDAEESVNRVEEMWEESTPFQKKFMLDAMRDGAMESQRLLDSKTITDADKQMQVYKTQMIYSGAYQAFLARISESDYPQG